MSSTVPAVLAALTAVSTTALPAVQVADGSVLQTEPDLFIVGYAERDIDAVTGLTRPTDFGVDSYREEYDVTCLLSTSSGDDAVPVVRARLYGYLATLHAAWRAQQDLGIPGVSLALGGEFAFGQANNAGEGSVATLRFSVRVIAFAGV